MIIILIESSANRQSLIFKYLNNYFGLLSCTIYIDIAQYSTSVQNGKLFEWER